MLRGNKEIHSKLRAKYVNITLDKEGYSEELKVLIIEDHPLMQKEIAKAFLTLNKSQNDYLFNLEMAFNCEEAYSILNRSIEQNSSYDLILLDIRLPPFLTKNIYSGEEIGQWIKDKMSFLPKIIIVTFINDKQRIANILKNLNPDGLIIKDDISCNTLLEAIKHSFEETPFYTQSVVNIARQLISNDLVLDQLDKRLLYELSCGATMSELVKILAISKSSIQKRKNKLMDIFDIRDSSVRNLVKKAKEKDFL